MVLDRQEREIIRSELARWAAWEERARLFSGYPSADNVQRSIMGKGGGIDGHRILCLERPVDVYATNQRVLGLPVQLRQVIETMHINVRQNGIALSAVERFKRIGLTEREGRDLYTQALMAVAGIPCT